jgi:hypothetical protein
MVGAQEMDQAIRKADRRRKCNQGQGFGASGRYTRTFDPFHNKTVTAVAYRSPNGMQIPPAKHLMTRLQSVTKSHQQRQNCWTDEMNDSMAFNNW